MAVALLLFAVLCAAWAVALGQGAGWDLRNYHLYSPWAWLHGRLDRDIAPAFAQGFYNPTLQFATLWGVTTLSPRAVTALLGFVQGLNAVPLFLLALRALPPGLGARRPAWALALALVGAFGATQLGELGATQGDNLVSLPLLLGAALLAGAPAHAARIATGGLLLGVAAGLKPTVAPFALGALLATPLLIGDGVRARARGLVIAGSAELLGLLVAAGPWMLELWSRYGSPLFPFTSLGLPGVPMPPHAPIDARFLPSGLPEALGFPLTLLFHPRHASEQWFRDLRVPLLFLSLPLLLWRPRVPVGADRSGAVRAFLWVAVAVFYLSWLSNSGYYRYAAPLEMLAPVLLGSTVLARWPERRGVAAALAAVLVLVVATTRAPRWGRVEFGDQFLSVQAPPLAPGAVVALAGERPLAFLALALGPDHDYVRISGNLVGEPLAPWWLDRRVAESLDRDQRPVVALFQDTPASVAPAYARFGLAVESEGCVPVRANLVGPNEPPILLCPARREQSSRVALDAVRAAWRPRCASQADRERTGTQACRAFEQAEGTP